MGGLERVYYFLVNEKAQIIIFSYMHTYSGFFYADWYGKWNDHVISWWQHRDEANVLFLKYEDLKKVRGSGYRRLFVIVMTSVYITYRVFLPSW